MIQDLKYVVEIAKFNSINKAAASLNVTQPTISHAIRKYEALIGYPIFKRNRSGTFPTDRGQYIVDKSKEVIQKMEELEALYTHNDARAEIRVVSTPGAINSLLKSVGKYRLMNPSVGIFITEETSKDIIEQVKNEDVDAGLLVNAPDFRDDMEGLSFTAVRKVKLVAAVNTDSIYAKRGYITYDEVKREKIVLFEDEAVEEFEQKILEAHEDLNVFFRTKNSEAVFIAIKENNTISIGHDFAIGTSNYYLSNQIEVVEIKDFVQTELEIGWLKKKTASQHVNKFIDSFNMEHRN